MDLNMATSEKASYIRNNVSNYNLQLQPSHININFFIYFFLSLLDQLTPMGFIPSGASTGTQMITTKKYYFVDLIIMVLSIFEQ